MNALIGIIFVVALNAPIPNAVPMTHTEIVIRQFVNDYYDGNSKKVEDFLQSYWSEKTKNEIFLRGFACTCRKSTVTDIQVVFGEEVEGVYIVSAHVALSREDGDYIAVFVFSIHEKKIIKLLPMERQVKPRTNKQDGRIDRTL